MVAPRTTTFPTTIDTVVDPVATDTTATPNVEHDNLHAWYRSSITALENKMGVDSSAAVTSLDYILRNHTHQGALVDRSAGFSTLNIRNALTTDLALKSWVGSETFERFNIRADGRLQWGAGSAAPSADISMFRQGTRHLGLAAGLNFQNITAPSAPSSGYTVYSAGSVLTVRDVAAATPLSLNAGVLSLGLATGYLDLSAPAGTVAAPGAGLGDKIALFGSSYGIGMASSRLVAYLPSSATAFAIRQVSASGAKSSGTEVTTFWSSGQSDFTGSINVDRGGATTHAHLGDHSAAPGGTLAIFPYTNARGVVIRNPLTTPTHAIEHQDNTGAALARLSSLGAWLGVGQANFGAGTLGAASGYTQVGNSTNDALVAAQHGTLANADILIRPKGTGVIRLQTSGGTDLFVGNGSPTLKIPTWNNVSVFSNGWVNYGGAEQVARYCKTAEGFVRVEGKVKNGTWSAGTVITNLPAGFRPPGNPIWLTDCGSIAGAIGIARLQVTSTGDIMVLAAFGLDLTGAQPTNNGWVELGCINFSVN